ncbi:NAD(P)-binding protein [Auricularia subglabra TFB-10046 SS5]|nr:NAD(P)-binding protein [Auricularia subglabra TFB-10046 SS5]
MPALPDVLAGNAANAPTSLQPVAVLVGGTSGVGRGVAEVLAKYTKGSAHLVLIGRNKSAADEIIAGLPAPANGGKYEFVQCDVSSMRNVGAVTRELSERLGKINYLVLSAGYLSLAGYTPTEDGVDRKLAVHYYSRFKFARDLVPLLEKAAGAGEPARVLTVLDSTHGGPIHFDDMNLEKHYSAAQAAAVGCTYNDAAVAALAKRYPTVSFTHAYPGLVNTGIFKSLPFGLRHISAALAPVLGTSIETCGENMVYSLFDHKLATGAHSRNHKGDDVPRNNNITDDVVEKVWEHSVAVCDGK